MGDLAEILERAAADADEMSNPRYHADAARLRAVAKACRGVTPVDLRWLAGMLAMRADLDERCARGSALLLAIAAAPERAV
jgi:hypothetical protein